MGEATALMRERIGMAAQRLGSHKCPKERAELAEVAGRTPRTIRYWKKNPRGGRPGRPPRSVDERAWARLMVFSELAAQKITASASSIDRALRPLGVARRLTFEFVPEFKEAAAREAREEAAARRLHVEVCATDAIASVDGTHAGREPVTEAPEETAASESPEKMSVASSSECLKGIEPPASRGERRRSRGRAGIGSPCKGARRAAHRRRGRAVQALMAVDVATMLKLGFKVVHASCGQDVIDLLIAIRAERGDYPLAISTDNGSENVNDDVETFLEEHRIIHLRNLPRTPRHNPWIERNNREVKAEAKIEMADLDPAIPLIERVAIGIDRAAARLNAERPRQSRGWKTAAQLDNAIPRAYDLVARDVFYAVARAAMQAARASPGSVRQQRLAERWALFRVMEDFGLVKLFRGGVPITAAKAERVA
jgi:transposase InsO family protein